MTECSVIGFKHEAAVAVHGGNQPTYRISIPGKDTDDLGLSAYSADKIGENCQALAYYEKGKKGASFLMKAGDLKNPPDFGKWNDHIYSIDLKNLKRDEKGKITHDLDRTLPHEELGDLNHFCPGGTAEPKSRAPHIRCTYSDSNATGVKDLYNAKGNDKQLQDMYQVVIQKFCKGKVGEKATDPVCKEPYITAAQVEEWNKRFCESDKYDDNWCNCYNIVNERCGELPDSTVCKNSELPQELASEDAIGEEGYKQLQKYKHCRRGVCPATIWRPENTPECPSKVNICGRDWNLGTASNSDIIRHCVMNSGRSPDDIKKLLDSFEQPEELGDWTVEKEPTEMEKEAFAFGQVVISSCLCIVCMGVLLAATRK